MRSDLTPGTLRRIAALFPESQRDEVARLLYEECGAGLPFASTLRVEGLERIRFAVLQISCGFLDRLHAAIKLAQYDWRDVLVGAGFEHDASAHPRWLADEPGNSPP